MIYYQYLKLIVSLCRAAVDQIRADLGLPVHVCTFIQHQTNSEQSAIFNVYLCTYAQQDPIADLPYLMIPYLGCAKTATIVNYLLILTDPPSS